MSAATGALILACRGKETLASSPSLVLLDSVRLAESDSSFVGIPTGLAIGRDGKIWIPDARNNTIHEFAPSGAHIRDIGRRGSGPAEFTVGPTEIILASDSIGMVESGPIAVLLDLSAGTEIWKRVIPSSAIPPAAPLAYQDSRFIFRSIDPAQRTSLIRLSAAADTPDAGGPFPELLGPSHILNDNFSRIQVAPIGQDSIALAIELSDYLYFGTFHGPFDSVYVSRTQRHGAERDLLRKITDADPQKAGEAVYLPSVPMLLRRLPDGKIVLVTGDLVKLSTRIGATLYLSVIDLNHRATCPDALIPVPDDPLARVAIRNDTLAVLAQVLPADGSPYTVLRRYRIESSHCSWIGP